MPQEIKTIELPIKLGVIKLGSVNCYLVKNGTDYILIDTGPSNKRFDIEKELEGAGCTPENLNLIILTHGDFDHTGNADYLREKFDAKIAMHYGDLEMVRHGDMFWNRKGHFIIKMIAPILFGFGKSERFRPDLHIDNEHSFSEYGFNAKVIYLPGHSKGSIGILTDDGDLFCGDLLTNNKKPTLNSIIDDKAEAEGSVEKLKNLKLKTVYPGHGKQFSMDEMAENREK
ncbi:MBL fold metallo-hydrolase [Methanobacterium sp.]|uniref:MBL fold metallo-hydrolase n=1 Tax=Methanobacterium sp. TaxID=2164 RepID=UPI003C76BCBF